ncbi:50S ribosomal chloroplastic [Micractinium conductrix]|uniref:50S ribosomal protein L35 n=1 Tax=Micractinium conductrix TaxID=554055 RepID=A0A2P6VKC3_9CHLO|nr:50S ribosomal chloroplastic [Micractinium conductrix]|eukprot:PSC74543.1 50S ribosomal chloroplastic [Micractinium conductrix]
MAALLCAQLSSLRISARAPKPFAAAKSLGSVANGIAAAPRPTLAVQRQQQQQPASLALEVVCADGPRGMKLKTRKSAAKRYKLTGSGKVMVRRAGKQHLNEKQSRKTKRNLSKMVTASDSHKNLIRGCLPYAKIK